MKRAKQLQPLSRQHHLGLNLSRHAKECVDEPKEISKHWHNLTSYINDMSQHFQIEDDLIGAALLPYKESQPEVATAINTLDEQHKSMYKLIEETKNDSKNITVDQVKQLGHLLYDHIRFEERELYPLTEKYLTEAELDAIYAASPEHIKRVDEGR
ncbi:hemerythrin domain-containing protein [Psychrobacter jeotgali]|uniref:hemerythrin domain-containing protein n=1 Tax=Psychrobacter jeotgali TaxID=179010 RepID=UPI001917BC31|nr:hemerythrin domain-containing protein [Psychrobacter jeotgali]